MRIVRSLNYVRFARENEAARAADEVYRATDMRLGCDVAFKILPPDVCQRSRTIGPARSPAWLTEVRVRTTPFNPINARSTAIFPRSMLISFITYTSMLPLRMGSPNRHATLHALCTRALRVRRPPRLDRGVKFFLRLRSSHLFQRQSVKPQGLTPFFSMAPFHFLGLLFPSYKNKSRVYKFFQKTPGLPSPFATK